MPPDHFKFYCIWRGVYISAKISGVHKHGSFYGDLLVCTPGELIFNLVITLLGKDRSCRHYILSVLLVLYMYACAYVLS